MARLVVDDEPDILLLHRLNLEAAGHEVLLAADGMRALERIAADKPDAVVLDVMMPVLDGWGVLDRLATMPMPPPVLVVSAKSGPRRHRTGHQQRRRRLPREAVQPRRAHPLPQPAPQRVGRRRRAARRRSRSACAEAGGAPGRRDPCAWWWPTGAVVRRGSRRVAAHARATMLLAGARRERPRAWFSAATADASGRRPSQATSGERSTSGSVTVGSQAGDDRARRRSCQRRVRAAR